MNRSILIVICDFLLVSLLAFSTVDINKVGQDGSASVAMKMEVATNQTDSGGGDLTAVMKLALDEERRGHEQLQDELAKTRGTLEQQQALLGEHEKQTAALQQQLQSREQQARQLQQEQASLQQQYAAAQTNVQALNQQLQSTSTEAVMSKEKLAAMEAEAKRQSDQAAALEKQLAQLAKSNQMVLNEKQQLSTQLQIAEVEKRSATEQVARMTDEVKVERAEKAKLADGVQALAVKSGQLEQQIKENTPLAPNTIFNEFVSNRLAARFTATKPGIISDVAEKRRDTETILVTDGTNIFALCHVQDTPLAFAEHATDWDSITGTLGYESTLTPIRSLGFDLQDPRVVLMPVTADEAKQLGGKVYRLAADPFKFQDAVLVGAREGYYGECKFQLDLSAPQYLKLDRSVLKGLFGKFNPSRGDLVFSRTGQLLGIMANDTYCLIIQNFQTMETLRMSDNVRDQHTAQTLSSLYALVSAMPSKLQ